MSAKKIASILNLIEIAESNLKTSRNLLAQLAVEMGGKGSYTDYKQPANLSTDEDSALEVVEGYFDGESMIGDNGQMYVVPPNYASKTQLVLGDRMKWILTKDREVYKLIQAAPRERVTGTFTIEGDNYLVLIDKFPTPVKILKASATYAMKNLGLQIGDEVAITVPKDTTPLWGAFNTVIKGQSADLSMNIEQTEANTSELDNIGNFGISGINLDSQNYF
ncbi:MAG: hypothetical protein H7196_05200 [candidate division SR1 bacterium]|nr:hypothetical protein [candidate division SR1 bacterium]